MSLDEAVNSMLLLAVFEQLGADLVLNLDLVILSD